MKKRLRKSAWTKTFERGLAVFAHMAMASGTSALKQTFKQALKTALRPVLARRAPPPGAGDWIAGDRKSVV